MAKTYRDTCPAVDAPLAEQYSFHFAQLEEFTGRLVSTLGNKEQGYLINPVASLESDLFACVRICTDEIEARFFDELSSHFSQAICGLWRTFKELIDLLQSQNCKRDSIGLAFEVIFMTASILRHFALSGAALTHDSFEATMKKYRPILAKHISLLIESTPIVSADLPALDSRLQTISNAIRLSLA